MTKRFLVLICIVSLCFITAFGHSAPINLSEIVFDGIRLGSKLEDIDFENYTLSDKFSEIENHYR